MCSDQLRIQAQVAQQKACQSSRQDYTRGLLFLSLRRLRSHSCQRFLRSHWPPHSGRCRDTHTFGNTLVNTVLLQVVNDMWRMQGDDQPMIESPPGTPKAAGEGGYATPSAMPPLRDVESAVRRSSEVCGTHRHRHTHTDTHTHIHRQTDRQTDRRMDRQTNRHTTTKTHGVAPHPPCEHF